MRQDRATFQKTSVAGLHILKCLFYMVDNIHLTTLTQHVMVGITRSKVIFCLILPPGDFQEETLTAMALAFLAPTGTIGYGESDVRPCVTKRPKSL